MHIQVVTLFPQMFEALNCGGVTGRAIDQGLLQLGLWNPRDFATDRHRTVDDRPYGGGPGMVMMVEPLRATLEKARAQTQQISGCRPIVAYMSPQGRRITQATLQNLAQRSAMIFVCGRYEGVDERLIESEIDEEYSIGDYVLSGGELATMVIIDGLARLIPGVLGHPDSARQDSFVNGLLEYPHFTRPAYTNGKSVPEVLLSGDHRAIRRWREKQALGRTWLKRPDLLESLELNEEQQALLDEFKREYTK